MIRYNVPLFATRQAPMVGAPPVIGVGSARWSGRGSTNRPSAASLGAAMLLHLAVGLFLLTFVRLPTAPPALDDQVVALIFAPASHPAPPPVPSVAAVAPNVPPAPPLPPEAPDLAAVPPPPPEPASPAETPPPAIPPPPPTADALVLPEFPAPPPPPPHPRSKPRPAEARRPPPAARLRPRPAAPAQPPVPTQQAVLPQVPSAVPPSAVPSAAPSAAANSAEETASSRAAPPAPIAAGWQHAISGWLEAHQTYPEEARRRGEEGRAVLRFTVDRSGKVLEVTLVSGSGSPRLDDAALAILHDATLPPFPVEMRQDRVTVTVQIRYRLTD